MIAYEYDEFNKIYVGELEAQKDPLESIKQHKDIWLLPANSTWQEPPEEKEGFYRKWDGDKWIYEEIQQDEQNENIETSEV